MKLITGNDLKTGIVTWWTGEGWSEDFENAVDAGDDGEAIIENESAAQRVNSAYIVDADDNGMPLHIKERMRAAGPTVREDLSIHPEIKIAKG